MSSHVMNIEWKSKNFYKKVTEIRASQIRASQIRASQIRATEIFFQITPSSMDLFSIFHELNFIVSGGLTDEHILELASFITDLTELRDLGVRVLGLSLRKVNAPHNDSRRVDEAACNILEEWRKKQKSSLEAFNILCEKLRQIKWNQALHELEHLGETATEGVGLSPQSMWTYFCSLFSIQFVSPIFMMLEVASCDVLGKLKRTAVSCFEFLEWLHDLQDWENFKPGPNSHWERSHLQQPKGKFGPWLQTTFLWRRFTPNSAWFRKREVLIMWRKFLCLTSPSCSVKRSWRRVLLTAQEFLSQVNFYLHQKLLPLK